MRLAEALPFRHGPQGGAGKVRCMPRLEEARAEERGNTRVGRLPMRSVSNTGNFQQRSFACPRIFARGRKAGIIAILSYQLPNAAKCNWRTLIGSTALAAYGDVDGPSAANNHPGSRKYTARLLRRSDASANAHGCAGTRSARLGGAGSVG